MYRFARSPQWYHERPNADIGKFEQACYQYIPLYQRLHRFNLFNASEDLVKTYVPGEKAAIKRATAEEKAKQYIYDTAPEKYHKFLVPDFPLGCKRRIFDPGYLASLHSKNLRLAPEGIQSFDETGITSESGEREEFDVVVLATGFQVTRFLTPMVIYGKTGVTLEDQWKESRGAQAYLGTYVHNFPNFAVL